MAKRETAWVAVCMGEKFPEGMGAWIAGTRVSLKAKVDAEAGFPEMWRPVKVYLTLATKPKKGGKRGEA